MDSASFALPLVINASRPASIAISLRTGMRISANGMVQVGGPTQVVAIDFTTIEIWDSNAQLYADLRDTSREFPSKEPSPVPHRPPHRLAWLQDHTAEL